MSDGTLYTCGGCGAVIDPEAHNTVAAHHQIPTPDASGGQTQFIDGEGVYFHRRCYPGDSRWQRRAS